MKFLPEQIAEFWEINPCGSSFMKSKSTLRDFFVEYDNFKYSVEPHIPHELSKIDFNNKKVLEIGLGQGAEAQKIIGGGGSAPQPPGSAVPAFYTTRSNT